MQYRKMGNTGDEISALGYGCMRFPRSGLRINEALAERQVLSAIDRGVNYLDTAYIYPGKRGGPRPYSHAGAAGEGLPRHKAAAGDGVLVPGHGEGAGRPAGAA